MKSANSKNLELKIIYVYREIDLFISIFDILYRRLFISIIKIYQNLLKKVKFCILKDNILFEYLL